MRDEPARSEFAPAERASPETVDRQSRLVEQSEAVRQLYDAVTEIVVVLNGQRQIVFCNRPLVELAGAKDRRELYGLRPGEALRCEHACQRREGCGTTEFCSQCGAVKAILTSLQRRPDIQECHLTRADREGDLDLLVRTTPVTVDGEAFVVAAVTDISHENRRRAMERVFFHDILNTAFGVSAGLDGLPQVSDEAGRRSVEVVRRGVGRMLEGLLAQRDLMAAESNELAVNPASLDSLTCLEEAVRNCEPYEALCGCLVRLDPGSEAVEFQSDPTLLARVLGNMLKNAIEASGRGQAVTAGCRSAGGRVEFWVHNPGFIPRPVQLQLFHRSFSTKGEGRGLGTYSMKLLTERFLRGTIEFTSSEAEGTTFTASYPLVLRTH